MNDKFHYSFDELFIQPQEIEELMGFDQGQSPDPFPELIENGLKRAPSLCNIEGGFRIFENFSIDQNNETLRVKDQIFYPGKIVISQLKNATSAALFACTAGAGITDEAKKVTTEGDSFLSYVLDVIGSVTVDKAAEKIQDEILSVITPDAGITDPFSPGYCNWSVAEQQKLFALLPPGFCGIALSKSSLMSPIKSVSGISGIGKNCERKGYQCNWCDDITCIYGKIRRIKKT